MIPIEVAFQPRDDIARTSLFIVRNNLTIIETVVVQGQGGLGELRFSNRKPGSQKPLTFDMTDKHLKNCDKKTHSKNVHPNFTVKRTFTMRNTGQLPLYLHGFHIGNSPCEGYGFKILDCAELELPPNASHKVDIAFTPDFTMSRIRQILTLHTSLGTPVNYSLQATIPTHMLTQCAGALPRPHWEPVLYCSMVLAMGFLLVCVILAAYFEADRLFTADVMKRRSELNQLTFDKSKVFDLKAIANFKLPNDTSAKISSNLYMSRRLPVSLATTVSGHTETGKTPPSGSPPHRRESWWSKVLHKLTFWQSSSATAVTVVNVKQASPDVAKDLGNSDAAKAIGTASSVAASGDRATGKVGMTGRLGKYLAESYTGHAVLQRICKAIIPKRLSPKSTKPAKSALPSSSDKTKDLNAAAVAADPDTNTEQNQPPPAAANSQKRNAEQDHSRRLLEVKPMASNKEKTRSASPSSANSTAATATQGPVNDEPPASKKEGKKAPKNQKLRKPKASELKRVNKKLQESEKADKDDSSSTTTETSSIEADEKSMSSPQSQENVELSKSKKTRSKVRRKESTKSSLPEDSVAPAPTPNVTDEFLAISKPSGKANRKTKSSQNCSNSPNATKLSSVELTSYSAKRDEAASKETKPKQVCLPLPTAEMPSPHAQTTNRKNGSKSRSPGLGQVYDSSRYQKRDPSPSSASIILWDMPQRGCDEHDALSELSAQTDVFAKTRSIPVAASKPPHEPLGSPPIHSSSYSSIVSNTGKVGDHQLPPPPTVVNMTPRPSPEGLLATGDGNSDNLVINSCQPSGLITMSGTMPARPTSSRPVAAVGATVRRPWAGAFNQSQSLPEELTSGSCQSSLAEMDLPMASANRMYYENHLDSASMAGFSGLGAPTLSYLPPEGYDPYGYGPPMMTNPLDHQVTLMQRLQAERRKRVYEYELKKHRESGAEWPGFELPMTLGSPEPTLWEPITSPANLWGTLPSSTLGVRPSGQAGMWNMGATSSDTLGWIGGGNIWSSPELETKLIPPSPTDLGDELHSGSAATGGVAGPSPIFDPFNTLEIRTGSIWNPNSTESSMTSWGFGVNNPNDNNSMK